MKPYKIVPMKIAITGSNGFIGSALAKYLTSQGREVYPIVRNSSSNKNAISWDIHNQQIDKDALNNAQLDAVVHLAGESIGAKKWTEQQKQEIRDSRIKGTTLLSNALAEIENKPSIFISGSAMGYYGDRADEKLYETSAPGDDFLSHICQDWEKSTAPAEQAGIKTAHIRTGHVLEKSGGLLKPMLLPFKLGIGGKLGKGNQYMSWISITDHIKAIEYLMNNKLEGNYNLVAPNPVTNEEFTKALGARLKRPTLLPTPLLPLKIKFSSEFVNDVMLSSQRVYPKALQDAGFKFEHETIEQAFKDEV